MSTRTQHKHPDPWRDVRQRLDPTGPHTRAARLRRGSRDGRPPGFDEERYRTQDTVERAVNRLTDTRAVATRHGRRGYVRLGTATAAALVTRLRM